jgi:methionyl-tRNA synthetase
MDRGRILFFFVYQNGKSHFLIINQSHPNFIDPESRKNEVISFVKSGLKDLIC